MTTEEKAKAYDEALKDMRLIYPSLKGDAKLAVEHAFPELKESEDERMRKLLVWQVKMNIEDETSDLARSVYNGVEGHDPDLEESIEEWKKCLAWLEKQKEQKPLSTEETELNSLAFLEQLGYTCIPEGGQKPAEWSKEDEMRINHLIDFIEKFGLEYFASTEKVIEFLKSLRNRIVWKPSEEQMEWLETAFKFSADKPGIHRIIESLLIDLKKL